MEEKSTGGKYVEELESSSPSANSNTEQISEDRKPTEQPSTLKEVASIRDVTMDKHQLSSSNISTQMNNDNYAINILDELSEQWIGKEMNLHVITDRKDAILIINRIFQDVERGLLNAQFRVEEFNHLCDLTLTLKIAPALASFPSAVTAINPDRYKI